MSTPVQDADPETVARNIVLRSLTASARTRRELEQTLSRKQVPEQTARLVLDRMEDVGLVDDAAYAQAFVESRRDRPGWSRRSIQQRLRDKGVDRDLIDQALAELTAEEELDTAVTLVRSRWARMRDLPAQTRQRRVLAALARRGYTADITRRAMQCVAGEDDDAWIEGGADDEAAAAER